MNWGHRDGNPATYAPVGRRPATDGLLSSSVHSLRRRAWPHRPDLALTGRECQQHLALAYAECAFATSHASA